MKQRWTGIVVPQMVVADRWINRKEHLLAGGAQFVRQWDFVGAEHGGKMRKLAGQQVATPQTIGIVGLSWHRFPLRTAEPVSYTHLDVYKRQLWCCTTWTLKAVRWNRHDRAT